MPAERRPRTTARPAGRGAATPPPAAPPLPLEPGTTGRLLVLLGEGADARTAARTLTRATGVSLTSSAELGNAPLDPDVLQTGSGVHLDSLGVLVLEPDPDQAAAVAAATGSTPGILAVEPERIVYALEGDSVAGYVQGFRDGVDDLAERVLGLGGAVSAAGGELSPAETFVDTDTTWGLKAVGAVGTTWTGKGIRVAVLDTGFDSGHPDFVGRTVTRASFITGQTADDGHGHGTHCIGTACGPRKPQRLPAYGIAAEAEIYAGKVLSNQGSGADGGILAGIDWAVRNTCRVISMSLGAPVALNAAFSTVYETVAQRALAAGSLIVAAAGNESSRPGRIAPVGHPANCPSIVAVAALDSRLGIAPFSSGGMNLRGGQIDVAAPGVAVISTAPRPRLYATMSGTSMATPHVAGLVALHAQANPGMVGGSLGWLLLQSARRLALPNRDVGGGLAQAPGAIL
jgi:subtilisin family serine protease